MFVLDSVVYCHVPNGFQKIILKRYVSSCPLSAHYLLMASRPTQRKPLKSLVSSTSLLQLFPLLSVLPPDHMPLLLLSPWSLLKYSFTRNIFPSPTPHQLLPYDPVSHFTLVLIASSIYIMCIWFYTSLLPVSTPPLECWLREGRDSIQFTAVTYKVPTND